MKIETLELALERFDRVEINRDHNGYKYTVRLSWSLKRANGSVTGEGKTAQEAVEQAIAGWPNSWPVKYAEFVEQKASGEAA